MDYSQFDVFLCHNSKEKSQVEQIREQLRTRGIYAWLDQYDFEPFRPWQKQLEEIMPRIKAAAIFLGSSGVGPWHNMEMRGFLQEFVERDLRIGLVILPGCPDELIQQVPRFLKDFHYVDFRQIRPHPMGQLIWGITGNRPTYEEVVSVESASELIMPNQPDTEDSSDLDKLEILLSAQNWQEADEQTKRIILKDNQNKRLTAPNIRQLSLDLLDSIDLLWMGYGDEKFGLRIQRQLWQESLQPRRLPFNPFKPFATRVESVTESQAWNRFGCLVGWRSDDEKLLPDAKLDFSMKAPSGCFPRTRLWLHGGYGNDVKQFVTLMKRVAQLD